MSELNEALEEIKKYKTGKSDLSSLKKAKKKIEMEIDKEEKRLNRDFVLYDSKTLGTLKIGNIELLRVKKIECSMCVPDVGRMFSFSAGLKIERKKQDFNSEQIEKIPEELTDKILDEFFNAKKNSISMLVFITCEQSCETDFLLKMYDRYNNFIYLEEHDDLNYLVNKSFLDLYKEKWGI